MSANEKLRVGNAQRSWADRQDPRIEYDRDGYCLGLRQNLFQELTACARRELDEGDGAELGKNGQRGKLQALHSSSALPHVHIHLIPRYAGDDADPRGGVRRIFPKKADYWTK